MKEQFVITIKADDRPGLLHLITGILNRKLIPIISLNAASTDIRTVVLITMEVEISEKALTPLLAKIENIIEVFAVEAQAADEAICQCAAYFKMNKAVLTSPQIQYIRDAGMQVVRLTTKSVLLTKSGTAAMIRKLYNDLDGPHLTGFSQTGLISDSELIGEDQSSVINRLAA